MKKLLLSIIALFTFSFSINAQNVNIPDANFKAALVAHTGININGDTEIQISEANNYSGALNVSQQNISNMTGIEEFTNIFNLNCGQNPITGVYLANNVALTSLTVNFTQISTLDVSNLVNLTTFNGTDNLFTDIDLSNNTNLTIIRVANNSLTDLNVKNGNNSNVTFFQAQNNSGLTCIEVDNVAFSTSNWNNIDATASFSTDCSVPPCTINIPDANFKAYLVGNSAINTDGGSEIECTEASAFSGMININNQSVTDLTGLEAFSSLTTLSCDGNSLSNIDISANTTLVNLYCSYNNLTSLDLTSNTSLDAIEATNNNLSSIIIANSNSLTFINVIDNNFTSFDFTNLSALEGFRCSGNQITSLDLSSLTSLNQLYCDNNNLSSLDVSNGNNINFWTNPGGTYRFSASSNPNLTCIQVDDATWSTTNWTDIDPSASFSENCIVLVNAITVESQSGDSTITTMGGTLQMQATVLPANADDATYTWSVVNGTGAATIDVNGLLTASADGTVDVIATANDASGTTGSKTITISNQSVGINDISFENVSIYPNPTSGILNLEIEEALTSIKIIDISGRTLQVFNAENTQLDISEFISGIYFLEIANNEKKSIIKIIKK